MVAHSTLARVPSVRAVHEGLQPGLRLLTAPNPPIPVPAPRRSCARETPSLVRGSPSLVFDISLPSWANNGIRTPRPEYPHGKPLSDPPRHYSTRPLLNKGAAE